MSTYVIGDLHGCHHSLLALLDCLPLSWSRDRLWLTGDLVNRGRHSLATLEWAFATAERLGERFACVLGNHDLLLLAFAAGRVALRPGDALQELRATPQTDELLAWLRQLPLLVEDPDSAQGRVLLVHAGLLPSWTVDDAVRQASAASERLRRPDGLDLAAPERRSAPEGPGCLSELPGSYREARKSLLALTRLRLCDREGRPQRFFGPPEDAPPGLYPWYDAPGRRSRDALVLFGHWAALGFRRLERAIALDSGCVWGGGLSAIRLEDGEHFHVPTQREDIFAT